VANGGPRFGHSRWKLLGIHPWWAGFGQAVTSPDDLTSPAARDLASAIAAGTVPAVTLTGLKERTTTGHSAVALEIEVERPQDLAHPIRATEPVAVVFAAQGDAAEAFIHGVLSLATAKLRQFSCF
jgi:hypothetical protein